jgi:hypothetical protein
VRIAPVATVAAATVGDMDARLVALALAVALIVALYAWLRRELTRLGAATITQRIAMVAYVLTALGWVAVYLLRAPLWLGWLASLPAALMTLLPARFAELTEGLEARVSDRLELQPGLVDEIDALGRRLTDRREVIAAAGELERRIDALDAWRTESGTAPVDELVHLFQGWALDRLAGRPRDPLLEADREERIAELLAGLDPAVQPGTVEVGAARPSWARLATRLPRLRTPVGRATGSGLRSRLDSPEPGGRRSGGQRRG